MEGFVPTVRISQLGRDQLVKMKRTTGLKQWNVLCRWALCASLRDETAPAEHHIGADTALEIDWRTFAGEFDALYLALLKQRCEHDGIEQTAESLQRQLRLHLHRGIAYLAAAPGKPSLSDLLRLAEAA